MTERASYISIIRDVHEVALTGTADAGYWRAIVGREGLILREEEGRAALLLTAIESRFRGIPFRELSISVVLDSGALLLHAFNSSRLLAFAERAFFQTPYHRAELALDERVPARFAAMAGGDTLFSARMGSRAAPVTRVDEVFEGPIYLPGGSKVFYARLSGVGDVFPFVQADQAEINPHAHAPIFKQLIESGFAGREWLVRSGAVHARSRTYPRDSVST